MTQRVHLWLLGDDLDDAMQAIWSLWDDSDNEQAPYVMPPTPDDLTEPEDLRKGDLIVVEDTYPLSIVDAMATPEKAAHAGCATMKLADFLKRCGEYPWDRPERPGRTKTRVLDL